MKLIIGTRLDGCGWVRIIVVGGICAFLIFLAGAFVFDTYEHLAPKKTQFVQECLATEEIPSVRLCNELYEIKKESDAVSLKIAARVAARFVGYAILLWLVTGFIGWVYRGFMRKEA